MLYDLSPSNYVNELLGSIERNMYIYNVLLYVTIYYPIFDFSQTAARVCFKFCVDVPCVDPY